MRLSFKMKLSAENDLSTDTCVAGVASTTLATSTQMG